MSTTEYVGRRRADAPRAVTIFGREPAAWVGLIEAALALLVLFPVAQRFGLTAEWAVLVMAAVSALAGLYTAWATKDTALGAILGLAKALIGLGLFYQWEVSTEIQAGIMSILPIVFGFFQRTQTSPVAFPSNPPVLTVTAVPADAGDVELEDLAAEDLERISEPQIDSGGVRWPGGC